MGKVVQVLVLHLAHGLATLHLRMQTAMRQHLTASIAAHSQALRGMDAGPSMCPAHLPHHNTCTCTELMHCTQAEPTCARVCQCTGLPSTCRGGQGQQACQATHLARDGLEAHRLLSAAPLLRHEQRGAKGAVAAVPRPRLQAWAMAGSSSSSSGGGPAGLIKAWPTPWLLPTGATAAGCAARGARCWRLCSRCWCRGRWCRRRCRRRCCCCCLAAA